jgi:hypothetical protein
MPLLSILNCARPVLFYNDCQEYPYSTSGTAFIVSFNDRLFVITAKHVLRLREFEADQFRVQYRPDRPELVPTRALYTFRRAQLEDTDQDDVAAWEVELGVRKEMFSEYRPYTLEPLDEMTIFSEASHYLYRGYPTELRQIDFEARRYQQDSISGAADYCGRSPTINFVHKLRFRYLEGVNDLDGLSGAPVFQTVHVEQNYSAEAFAGMLLRGTRASMTAHFLEHRRIIQLLLEIEAGRVEDLTHPPRP